MTTPVQLLWEVLDRQGYRLTSPRLRLLEAIIRKKDHFTAEEVHTELPSVGRATVYRTLKLLVELGLVCKMALDDGTPRYRVGPTVHHHHLICVTCGRVQDFARCTVEDVILRLQQATGYQVVGHRIELYGICPVCQAAEPEE